MHVSISNYPSQVKTALDMEIAVYKQLLETEESRLGIKPELSKIIHFSMIRHLISVISVNFEKILQLTMNSDIHVFARARECVYADAHGCFSM